MKLNNITITDYRSSDDNLIVYFVNTSFAEVKALDSENLSLYTDEGTHIVSFSEYSLKSITVDIIDESNVTAVYTHSRETVLLEKIKYLEAENEMISDVLDALLMGDLEV